MDISIENKIIHDYDRGVVWITEENAAFSPQSESESNQEESDPFSTEETLRASCSSDGLYEVKEEEEEDDEELATYEHKVTENNSLQIKEEVQDEYSPEEKYIPHTNAKVKEETEEDPSKDYDDGNFEIIKFSRREKSFRYTNAEEKEVTEGDNEKHFVVEIKQGITGDISADFDEDDFEIRELPRKGNKIRSTTRLLLKLGRVDSMTKKNRAKSPEMICQICGNRANGYHYNVLACSSCTYFFKRAITKRVLEECTSKNKCEIKWDMQEKCQECRFNKCLSLGMRPRSPDNEITDLETMEPPMKVCDYKTIDIENMESPIEDSDNEMSVASQSYPTRRSRRQRKPPKTLKNYITESKMLDKSCAKRVKKKSHEQKLFEIKKFRIKRKRQLGRQQDIHNALERQRRIIMANNFNNLRLNLLSECSDPKTPKITIINTAIEDIKYLRNLDKKLSLEVRALQMEQLRLNKRLKQDIKRYEYLVSRFNEEKETSDCSIKDK